MLRVALLVGSLVLLAACDEPTDLESASERALDVESAAREALQGVWTLVAIEIRGGPNPRVEFGSQIQPSLLIYTEGYVMWAFVTGTEPRPVDATIGEAARQYISAGGTYELDGSTLRYHRFVSLYPGAMVPANQPLVRELVTLTATSLETSGTNANGVTTILRYTRLE